MIKKLSMLVVVLCSGVGYAYSQANAANQPSVFFDPAGLISPSQHGKITTLGTGFSFAEGPSADRKGNVYFTDQPNDKIFRWDASSGAITLFLQGTGRANGTAFDKDGNLITCSDLHGEIWKIHGDGSHSVLVNNFGGKLLNGPNDVWINPVNGGMYFTDPIFPRPYWDLNDPRRQNWEPTHSEQAAVGKGGYVYYLTPGGGSVVRVVTDAMGWDSNSWPNGVVGSPDGKKLYVNKWAGNSKGGTWVFDIEANGTLSNMKKLTEWGGDGMSMDELGNIYISNGLGVMGFDPNGNHILTIPIQGGATNNTFGDSNKKLLFITTGGGSVLGVKMNVKGASSN